MNRKEAEDFIYRSYLRAAAKQDYLAKDRTKRHPELTRDWLRAHSRPETVLVTGSKGKGSVASFLAAILSSYRKTGLFTSPHITDFLERFRVDGRMMEEVVFTATMDEIRAQVQSLDESLPEDVGISPMGIEALLALKWFEQEQTGFQVMECGKGAKYDDVNNVIHQYAVINTILPEHLRELGDTIEEIAEDKACVITPDVKYVFSAKQTASVREILRSRAAMQGAVYREYGTDFWAEDILFERDGMHFSAVADGKHYPGLTIPMIGMHQAENAALAVAVADEMLKEEFVPETDAAERVREALRSVRIHGRMEILSREPFVLLDACITRESAKNVLSTMEALSIEKAIFLIGIPDDKDFCGVSEAIYCKAVKILLAGSSNPHYIFTDKQERMLRQRGMTCHWKSSYRAGLQAALRESKETGFPVVILGTTSFISETLQERCF